LNKFKGWKKSSTNTWPQIFESAIEVHRQLGPGLLESVYVFALVKELELRGIACQQEVMVPITYKGFVSNKYLRLDILVEKEVVVEVKSAELTLLVHEAQLVSHLRLAQKKLGFFINFNVVLLKNGFRRRVNNYFFEAKK
jgi:GxxExxY protein